jgi:hypothetical protein
LLARPLDLDAIQGFLETPPRVVQQARAVDPATL